MAFGLKYITQKNNCDRQDFVFESFNFTPLSHFIHSGQILLFFISIILRLIIKSFQFNKILQLLVDVWSDWEIRRFQTYFRSVGIHIEYIWIFSHCKSSNRTEWQLVVLFCVRLLSLYFWLFIFFFLIFFSNRA